MNSFRSVHNFSIWLWLKDAKWHSFKGDVWDRKLLRIPQSTLFGRYSTFPVDSSARRFYSTRWDVYYRKELIFTHDAFRVAVLSLNFRLLAEFQDPFHQKANCNSRTCHPNYVRWSWTFIVFLFFFQKLLSNFVLTRLNNAINDSLANVARCPWAPTYTILLVAYGSTPWRMELTRESRVPAKLFTRECCCGRG